MPPHFLWFRLSPFPRSIHSLPHSDSLRASSGGRINLKTPISSERPFPSYFFPFFIFPANLVPLPIHRTPSLFNTGLRKPVAAELEDPSPLIAPPPVVLAPPLLILRRFRQIETLSPNTMKISDVSTASRRIWTRGPPAMAPSSDKSLYYDGVPCKSFSILPAIFGEVDPPPLPPSFPSSIINGCLTLSTQGLLPPSHQAAQSTAPFSRIPSNLHSTIV